MSESTDQVLTLPIAVPDEWERAPLRDVVEFVSDGDWVESKDQGGSDFRLLQISNIGTGSFVETGNFRYITEGTFERLRCTEILVGDVLVARMPEPTGRAWFVSQLEGRCITAVDVAIVRPLPERVDGRYLSYFLNTPVNLSRVDGLATGTTRRRVRRADLARLEVPVPPFAEQRAIAGVLGALDDKIESNRRIVATSMAMSEATFLEWRGSLAAEETTTFGEFADVFGGATPSTSEPDYWGGDHVWVAPRDVTALDSVYLFDSERHVTELGLARSSTTLHPPGSIFMTSRATIGAFAVNQVPCAPNQGFIVVRPRDPATRWFLFHEMRSRVVEMQDRATGTTFRELSRGSFREMTLSIPADDRSFIALDEAVAPVHARAAAAAQESQSLIAIRDALLPELLSGRLRVREAEGVLEGSV